MKKLFPFLKKILDSGNEPDANGCWNWQGSISGKSQRNPHGGGYGNFALGGKTRYAHNLSYLLLVVLAGHNLDDYSDAEILEMLDAMQKNKTEGSHTCENRRCVNPLHQVRESHAANRRRTTKYRLTAEQVREIRAQSVKGKNTTERGNTVELAKKYGISRAYVLQLVAGDARQNTIGNPA
jgi:hypothetical protein